MARAHTITLWPNTQDMLGHQSQKSAQSTLTVNATEEAKLPFEDIETVVTDEHLDAFEEWEDQNEGETKDGPKRPPVRASC